jgi:hypothetical protein
VEAFSLTSTRSLGWSGNPEGFSPDGAEFAESSPDSASEPLVAVIHTQDFRGSGGNSDISLLTLVVTFTTEQNISYYGESREVTGMYRATTDFAGKSKQDTQVRGGEANDQAK